MAFNIIMHAEVNIVWPLNRISMISNLGCEYVKVIERVTTSALA